MRWYGGLPVQAGSGLLPNRYSRPGFFDTAYEGFVPFHWLRQMEREMDRMISSFFEGPTAAAWGASPLRNWSPNIQVQESEDRWILRAELPGIKPEQIEVTTTGNLLSLRAEERYEPADSQNGAADSTHAYRLFERSIPLPAGVQIEAVTAEYHNGVLEIHLPKTESAKRRFRRIPVGGSERASHLEGEVSQQALVGAKGGEASSPTVEQTPRKARRSKKTP